MNKLVKQSTLQVYLRPQIKVSSFFSRLLSTVGALGMLLLSSHVFASLQSSDATQSSAYECTQVKLDDVSKDLLTKEERIALLDQSLSDSIDSYSTCVSTVAQNMAGGGAGQGGGTGEGSDASQQGQAGASNDQNSAQTTSQNQDSQSDNSEIGAQANQQIADKAQGKGATAATRGIIPPANNDKIICKLLYQELTKTQDPDMIEGLRQQYNNYKCSK